MRYVPFDLQEWLANPKEHTVVWALADGGHQPLKDFTHLPNSRREWQEFVAIGDDGDAVFFNAAELAFELPDLPEEEWWVWEYKSAFGTKWRTEALSAAGNLVGKDDHTLWRIRVNRNTGKGTLEKVVTKKGDFFLPCQEEDAKVSENEKENL
jgi:hypothetical protein